MSAKFLVLLAVLACSLGLITATRPERCNEPHPTGVGMCHMIMLGYYFNPETTKCESYSAGGCSRTSGNSYATLEECQQDCEVTA